MKALGYILSVAILATGILALYVQSWVIAIVMIVLAFKAFTQARGYKTMRCYFLDHKLDLRYVYYSLFGVRIYCQRCKHKVEYK
jgi:hypothetical protein